MRRALGLCFDARRCLKTGAIFERHALVEGLSREQRTYLLRQTLQESRTWLFSDERGQIPEEYSQSSERQRLGANVCGWHALPTGRFL